MEDRLRPKHKVSKEVVSKSALKKTKQVIDSCGEASEDYTIPKVYLQESITMADNAEVLRVVWKMMADAFSRQDEIQQER